MFALFPPTPPPRSRQPARHRKPLLKRSSRRPARLSPLPRTRPLRDSKRHRTRALTWSKRQNTRASRLLTQLRPKQRSSRRRYAESRERPCRYNNISNLFSAIKDVFPNEYIRLLIPHRDEWPREGGRLQAVQGRQLDLSRLRKDASVGVAHQIEAAVGILLLPSNREVSRSIAILPRCGLRLSLLRYLRMAVLTPRPVLVSSFFVSLPIVFRSFGSRIFFSHLIKSSTRLRLHVMPSNGLCCHVRSWRIFIRRSIPHGHIPAVTVASRRQGKTAMGCKSRRLWRRMYWCRCDSTWYLGFPAHATAEIRDEVRTLRASMLVSS